MYFSIKDQDKTTRINSNYNKNKIHSKENNTPIIENTIENDGDGILIE